MDHVDKILAQWKEVRPDLDTGPMGLVGRISRLRNHLGRSMESLFQAHGLSSAGFDVLAALRRSGEPYRLSPGELIATTMVTSGTMTARLDQLEKAGLIERLDNDEDRRGVIIALTAKGLDLVDRVVTAHVENQHRLVATLSEAERRQLDALLAKFLAAFE